MKTFAAVFIFFAMEASAFAAEPLAVASITSNSVTLNWTKATDREDPQSALEYTVCQSRIANVTTVAQCEAAPIILPYTKDIATLAVTGLTPLTTYWWNVVVRDTTNQKAAYATISATTLAGDPPIPGGSGIITVASINTSSLWLQWVAATDSNPGTLLYEVRESGTLLKAYTAGLSQFKVSGLKASDHPTFTVAVKNSNVGSIAVYQPASVKYGWAKE